MKVSILIPAHNEEAVIGETLKAVLAQTYKDFEIIVIDNNCTDKTADKVRAFPQVKLVEEKQRGVQYARERGRREAKGEIIANLDADCLPNPDWVKTAVRYFDNPEAVAVSGPYYFYDGGKVFRTMSWFVQAVIFSTIHKLLYFLFKRGVFMMGGNAFIRAKTLDKIGGYNTAIAFYGDDTDTANRLVAHGKVVYTSKVYVGSSARRFQKMGALRTLFTYLINYFWVVVFKRPYHNGVVDK